MAREKIRCVHHLARTGGTLISRCLASMHGVCLLSEIHPNTTDRFSPVQQAAEWHGLVDPDERTHLETDTPQSFVTTMQLLAQRCRQRDSVLVVRDWSHIDFHGFPFHDAPASQLTLRRVLEAELDVLSVATVRHPVDHYLSLKRLAVLQSQWDDTKVLRGIREFAEQVQGLPWFRYEDFANDPDQVLKQICHAWEVPFDPGYRQRWPHYTRITGDRPRGGDRITVPQRRPIPDAYWSIFGASEDLRAALELLGYPLPWRLRHWKATASAEATADHLAAGARWMQQQAYVRAAEAYRAVLASDPLHTTAGNRLAVCLMHTGDCDQALAILREAIDNDPQSITTLRNLARCLEQSDRRFEAIPYRRRVVCLQPDDHENRLKLAAHLHGVGLLDEAIMHCRQTLRNGDGRDSAAADYLLYLNYSDKHSSAEISNEHFRIGMLFAERPRVLSIRPLQPSRRVRLAYISSDFFVHPVGKLIAPILEAHDSNALEVFVYHDGTKKDALTERIARAAMHYHQTRSLSDEALEQMMLKHEVDILVDLGGYTAGGNRLRVFGRRVAPLQVAFLGYPATAALPTVDYRITDCLADPPGLADRYYSERPLPLENGFLAYRPPAWVDQIAAVPRRQVRVGSFNNVAKISPTALDCWAEILRRSPGVVLVMKYGDRYEVPVVRDRFCAEFAQRGVCPSRLQFLPVAPSYRDHFRAMADVDLAFDSFPYQGTMTTLESLSVGTPIVSLAGDYYAHRATSAMLLRIGLHELVAADTAEYVEIACQLLSNVQLLRNLRNDVRERFHRSSICDVAGFTRAMEQAIVDKLHQRTECGQAVS